jgi:undecaprenyl-diphosphatase
MIDSAQSVRAFLRQYRPLLGYMIRIGIGLAIVLVAVYAFLAIAEDITNNEPIVRFDTIIVNAIHTNVSPSLVELMRLISLAGSEIPTVLTVLMVLYCLRQKAWYELLLIVTAVGGAHIMNGLLKLGFQRNRPTFTDPIGAVVGFSFPSGHAMGAMAFYGLMAYLSAKERRSRWDRIAIVVLMGIVVLLVGFSRVYLGAHYPSDVVAGYAAGLAWLALSISSAQALTHWDRRLLRSTKPV